MILLAQFAGGRQLEKHLKFICLDDSGHLVTAGPLVERAGGLIALRAGSAAEAMAIVEEDPLVRGAYQTYELSSWLMSNRQRLSPQLAAEIR